MKGTQTIIISELGQVLAVNIKEVYNFIKYLGIGASFHERVRYGMRGISIV